MRYNLNVNEKDICFEVDTGSFLSTISVGELKGLNCVVKKTVKRAKGYSDNVISFLGEAELMVKFNKFTFVHTFLIVKEDSVSLLGRDLCDKLNIRVVFPEHIKYSSVFSVRSLLLDKYKHYLSDEFESNVKSTVSLEVKSSAKPIFCKVRSVPLRFRELVTIELKRLEDKGIISRVFDTKWASPCVNVLKSNGSIRICGDYSTTVNKSMDLVQYPLPSIDDVISEIGDARVFSKIDCQNAYLQIPLEESSKSFTTINTINGLYCYNYLPFGLSNSPGIFQSFMCKVLAGIRNIIIYQDDILVLTSDINEHNKILDIVLTALHSSGIKINMKKSSFFTKEVHYLGYIFNQTGVHANPEKIRAILEAPKPTNLTQVQSFIGICNFYSRFIKNFSSIFAPLYNLMKKNVKFIWNDSHDKCFQTIKNLFKSNNVLKFFDPKLDVAIECDASSVGIGAVLLQKHDTVWCPVQFASRSLNTAERNYSQIEREALSVIFACTKFKQFILGSHFIIKNDHRPLEKLLGHHNNVPLNGSARLQRWALRLSQFNYTFQYSRGCDNVNSDFLSRLPLDETNDEIEPYELMFVVDSLNKTPINCKDIAYHTDKDSDLCLVRKYIKIGFPMHLKDSVLRSYKNKSNELSIIDNCILYKNRVVIPKSIREKVLIQLHAEHPGMSVMKSIARSLIWYPGLDTDIEDLVKSCNICVRLSANPSKNNFVQWPKTEKPWARIHIDHLFLEGYIILIVVDSHSKYIEAEVVKNVSSEETVECLTTIFSRHGLPDTIVSDNATSFKSSKFEEFIHNNSLNHITSPPYSPSSNGQAERGVRVIKDLMKKNSTGSFRTRLSNILLFYRSKPHSVTGISPCEALNNRKYKTVNDKINPLNISNYECNLSNSVPAYEIGDHVLALNMRNGPKWKHGSIMSRLGRNVYDVKLYDSDIVWKRHYHQLLPCFAVPIKDDNSNDMLINKPDDIINIDVSNKSIDSNINKELNKSTNVDNCPDVEFNNKDIDNKASVSSSNDVTLRRSSRVRKPIERFVPS